jgi:hypothetical protein
MNRSEEYRNYAQECRAIALRTEGFEQRIHLGEAEMWDCLAAQADLSVDQSNGDSKSLRLEH